MAWYICRVKYYPSTYCITISGKLVNGEFCREGREGSMGTLEDAFLTVYRQALVENKKTVTLEAASFPVRLTAKRKLKQVDFQFDGRELRGLEQNPETKSRWAAMARKGSKVMQVLERGKYIAVVADGKVHLYPGKR